MPSAKKPSSISEYIKTAPKEAQLKLWELREILKSVAPKATEAIKWGTPVFEEERILFSFKAFSFAYQFYAHPFNAAAF